MVDCDLATTRVRRASSEMLKVYGGTVLSRQRSEQLRAIVLTSSLKAAHEALDEVGFSTTKNEVNTHWSVSVNIDEMAATALAGVGKVLIRKSYDWRGKYRPARKADT